jgi:hypothetical protein
MKVVHKNPITIWIRLLAHGLISAVAAIMFVEGTIAGLISILIGNLLVLGVLYMQNLEEKWKLKTIEIEPYFKDQGFTLVSPGPYTILSISKDKVSVINVKNKVPYKNDNYKIESIYVNYPIMMMSHAKHNERVTKSLEIPFSNIASVQPLTYGEAGWKGAMKKSSFGIRLTTKNNEIIDVDTAFPNEFVTEIQKHIS